MYLNFYQRMGIFPLKKRVNRDKCSFATKQRMFGVFAIDEILRYRWTRFVSSRTLCHPGFPNFISQQSWPSSTDTLTPLIKSPLTPFWPPSLVPHLFPKMSVASSPQLLACKFYGINLRDNRCRRAALVPQTGPYVVSLQSEGCHNTSNYSFLLKTFLSGTVGSCSTVSYSSGFNKSNLIQLQTW